MEEIKKLAIAKANEIVEGEPFTDCVEVFTKNPFNVATIYGSSTFSIVKSRFTETFYYYDYCELKFYKLI